VPENIVIKLESLIRVKSDYILDSLFVITDCDQPLVQIYHANSNIGDEKGFIQGSIRLLKSDEYAKHKIKSVSSNPICPVIDLYEHDEF
jgi:hypothetical protein